jgi:hypothetical protein
MAKTLLAPAEIGVELVAERPANFDPRGLRDAQLHR